MAADRLTQLQKYYDEDPGDPFNVYGLALEYLKYDPDKSKTLFELLLTHHPDYTPTYYHAAKLSEKTGDIQHAIRIYEKGIECCKKLGETKALRELRSAFEELTSD